MDTAAFLKDIEQSTNADEFYPIMQSLKKKYPALAKHPFYVRRGEGPFHSETYPAWDPANPAPGVHTIEVRNKDLKGQELQNLLLGETFHVLGSINPHTNQPLDPTWFQFKQQFLQTLTPEQLQVDRQDYLNLAKQGHVYPSFGEYLQRNRIDAYLRGALSPMNEAEAKDWGATYTPRQKELLNSMKQYLENP
jgi:hypothetical protein